jgi:hypothetical protein
MEEEVVLHTQFLKEHLASMAFHFPPKQFAGRIFRSKGEIREGQIPHGRFGPGQVGFAPFN